MKPHWPNLKVASDEYKSKLIVEMISPSTANMLLDEMITEWQNKMVSPKRKKRKK